ncbi:hypothetical protein ACUXN9_000547 [Staphylococcus epidermidis]
MIEQDMYIYITILINFIYSNIQKKIHVTMYVIL